MKTFEDIALDKLREIQPATNKEWAAACGYDSTQAFYHTFNKLRKSGMVRKAGLTRPTKWEVHENHEYTFICKAGCGDFPLKAMRNCRDPEDPTLVCPECGCCQWHIVPPRNDPRYRVT